jgi:kynurenine formamidase
MLAKIQYQGKEYNIDLSDPVDISIPLQGTKDNLTAWYVDQPRFEPVMENGFVGDVNLGGAVNFRNIYFNPHGHGTHTECVGHISKEAVTINSCLTEFNVLASLVTIKPEQINGDRVISLNQIKDVWQENEATAIIIRTLPNGEDKCNMQYSNTNPPFIDAQAVQYLIDNGIDHLLIDTPSVDKEEDEGALISHHTFWEYPKNTQKHRTITELIYVPDTVKDGLYFLNLQIASFENDASPSKPLLYTIS